LSKLKDKGAKMKKYSLLIVVAISLVAFSVSANKRFHRLKGGKGPKMGMMGGHHMGMKGRKGAHRNILSKVLMLQHILKLDKMQMHKLMKLNIKYKIKKLQYKKVIAPLRIQLKILKLRQNINIPKIRKLMMKISSFVVNKKILKLQKQVEFEKQLKPVQKLKLRYIMVMHHGKKHKR
jgi:hypothetical protein